jgi:hypothetical protein
VEQLFYLGVDTWPQSQSLDLPGNALAYFVLSSVTKEKSFITISPGHGQHLEAVETGSKRRLKKEGSLRPGKRGGFL